MDSYNVNALKGTKANAMKKHPQLQKIASFFRLVEVCIFLALMSSFSTHLPVAVKNSGEYFRDISAVLVSPHFVFVMGNVIIITLFARSGHFSGQDSTKKKSSGYDLYDEFVKKSQNTQASIIKTPSKHGLCQRSSITERSYTSGKSEKRQDVQVTNNKLPSTLCITERPNGSGKAKESKRSHKVQARKTENQSKQTRSQGSLITEGALSSGETKNYRRSQSENLKHGQKNHQDRSQLVLRRSDTEKGIQTIDFAKKSIQKFYPEDKMSNDEFRGVVEAFIARQQKLRREEYHV